MKIAMLTDNRRAFDSLTHVYKATETMLEGAHEVIRLPHKYQGATEGERLGINSEIISRSDIVFATPDVSFLEARERVGKHIPYLVLLLGGAPRGMPNLAKAWKYLRTTDVLIGNCRADIRIIKAFFPNATSTALPFPFDQAHFFPLGAADRAKIRAARGFSPGDKILLYAGRITLEKNIHTLLRVFSVLQRIDARLHLIVAGPAYDAPFEDFGVYPRNFPDTLDRLAAGIGLDRSRLHLLGRQTPRQLQKLYALADVFVNMTLHHDENFGLAQVEAMACGTPVVGTEWGGLQDTLREGVTGFKASTLVTGAGVKANWLEAASRILELLSDPRMEAIRERCRHHAETGYSSVRYRQNFEDMLVGALRTAQAGASLELSRFGQKVWTVCPRIAGEAAPYRRGPESLHLYRRLIAPYAGKSRLNRAAPAKGDCVYLAWPVTRRGTGKLEVNDPLFPMTLVVPVPFRGLLRVVLRALDKKPVVALTILAGTRLKGHPKAKMRRGLAWMIDSGLLLTLRQKDAAAVGQGLAIGAHGRFFSRRSNRKKGPSLNFL
jgi:glycosyltransferase involved in cell wall biosynthesis